jgi:hypothetical protein
LDINVLEGYASSISRGEVTMKTEAAFSSEVIDKQRHNPETTSTLKMEAACSSETLVSTCKTTGVTTHKTLSEYQVKYTNYKVPWCIYLETL